MLYANLNYIDGVINFEVKKHQILLNLEKFTNNYNLPFNVTVYDDSE